MSAQQLCFNVHGSYHCGCYEGWSIDPSNPTECVDDDECLVSGKPIFDRFLILHDKGYPLFIVVPLFPLYPLIWTEYLLLSMG